MSIKEKPGDSYKTLPKLVEPNKLYKDEKGHELVELKVTFTGKQPFDKDAKFTIKKILLKACIEPVGRCPNAVVFASL